MAIPQDCFGFNRISDIEKKYYADGEDAYAMKRDLKFIAKQIEQERKSRKMKAIDYPIEEPSDDSEVCLPICCFGTFYTA